MNRNFFICSIALSKSSYSWILNFDELKFSLYSYTLVGCGFELTALFDWEVVFDFKSFI